MKSVFTKDIPAVKKCKGCKWQSIDTTSESRCLNPTNEEYKECIDGSKYEK